MHVFVSKCDLSSLCFRLSSLDNEGHNNIPLSPPNTFSIRLPHGWSSAAVDKIQNEVVVHRAQISRQIVGKSWRQVLLPVARRLFLRTDQAMDSIQAVSAKYSTLTFPHLPMSLTSRSRLRSSEQGASFSSLSPVALVWPAASRASYPAVFHDAPMENNDTYRYWRGYHSIFSRKDSL